MSGGTAGFTSHPGPGPSAGFCEFVAKVSVIITELKRLCILRTVVLF